MEPSPADEMEEDAASTVATVFESVKELTAENETLRASLAEARASHLGLLEDNRQLAWQVQTGAGAPSANGELMATEAKMAVLIAENNELESRERQSNLELLHERDGMAQLMVSHAEALAAAKQAAHTADAADAAAREEAHASRESADAAREAEALAAASELALANLRNELVAAREESGSAHRESAAQRREVAKIHAVATQRAADDNGRLNDAQRIIAELERQIIDAGAEAQRHEASLGEARGAAKHFASAAERMQEVAHAAQDDGAAQADAARESARIVDLVQQRERELEEHVATLTRNLDAQAETLERQSVAAQRAAAQSALAHTRALQEAQEATKRETRRADALESSLLKTIDGLKASREKDARERAGLQIALDRATAAASIADAQRAEGDPGSMVALREEMLSARAAAERSELQIKQLRSELQAAREEAVRERAVAEGRASELERAEVRGRRAVANAEAERDVMAAKLAQRGEAADAAIADARAAGERQGAEAQSIRRHAAAEVEGMRTQVSALRTQLSDAANGAAGLQQLLEAQQRVAEAYRREASRALSRLAQLEQAQKPMQHSIESIREEAASANMALAQQLQAQHSELHAAIARSLKQGAAPLQDVHKGIDELRAELNASRAREEEQTLALSAARLAVA